MKYMGSKLRIAKYILPIILKDRKDGQYYVEPFCGGCNTIDKVKGLRIGNDKNKFLISMWKYLCNGIKFPIKISKETYSYYRNIYRGNESISDDDMAMIGWIGFMGSFNGRFFDGGYSGHNVKQRDYISEQIRNTLSQIDNLKDIQWHSEDYANLIIPNNSIVYCDIPYQGTKQYEISKNFDYVRFWEWSRQKVNEGHKVFVSEYYAPNDFVCIWEHELKTSINQTITKKAVERLFVHESQI